MEQLGENLKELIIEKGLSLRKLSKASSVSAVQYGKYLNGATPSLEVAVRMVNYFNCSLDYLLGLTDVRNHSKYINKEYDLNVFLKRYDSLLKQNSISHWTFAKNNGLSESCLRHWKYGQTPKLESLVLIATNLSESVDYLLGRI